MIGQVTVAKVKKSKSVSKKAVGKALKPKGKAASAKAVVKPKPQALKPAPKSVVKAAATQPKPVASPAKPAVTPVSVPVESKKAANMRGSAAAGGRPVRKPKPKIELKMPVTEPLLRPGTKWKPLIPSGPKATPTGMWGAEQSPPPKPKSKLPKTELMKYKAILLRKRAELVGDISNMEDEALRNSSGASSHTPQHIAEQGSDTFEQTKSLELAQVDRNRIREIDDALVRIEKGTFGFCELTGKPIKPDRLAELPWTRYSIEAARQLERGSLSA